MTGAEGMDDIECDMLSTQIVIQESSTLAIISSFTSEDEYRCLYVRKDMVTSIGSFTEKWPYSTEDVTCELNLEKNAATCDLVITQKGKDSNTASAMVATRTQ